MSGRRSAARLRYTAAVPPGVIVLGFDPLLGLTGDLAIRWQTLVLAASVAVAIGVAGLQARRAGLRADDLLFIAVGAVPGAVIGGRLLYGLAHLDRFVAAPLDLLDPAVAGLDLAGGVVGGILAGAYIAVLLGAPVGRWAHIAVAPILLVLGLGRLAMAVGGSGQGTISDLPWATSYTGPGPWGSLAPALPSHPSQLYEAAGILLIGVAWSGFAKVAGSRSDGRALIGAVAAWAIMRAIVSLTWRDPLALGPLGATGALSLVVGAGALGLLTVLTVRDRRS